VQTVRSADHTGHRSATAQTVAVVSADELVVRRVRDVLRNEGIAIVERVPDVASLSPDAGEASAILLTGHNNSERRTLIRAARERFPEVPIVVVASMSTSGLHKSLEAGAAGLVLDGEIEVVLCMTIRAVCAGQIVVPQRFRRNAIRPPLSHREKETLALLATGLTNRQIAAQLFLAESTVKTHLTSVFAKLGVGSRSEATALALDPDEKLGLNLPGFPAIAGLPHPNGNGDQLR
jgi:DNA-binding NarL/FixJ family response regulator